MMKKFLCSLLVFIIIITSSAIAFSKSMGDVNSDGNVNSSDALLILKCSVGMNPTDFNASLADMNEDGNINSSDALIVLKISVGLIQPDENEEQPQNPVKTKADVIKFFNAETAKATKGTYKVTRGGKFIKNIDVGSLTGALNSIITGVDKNASLDSVVGGFLGIKAQPIVGTAKGNKYEGFEAKYALKAMNLTEADVVDFAVNGNTYKIKVKDCTTPDANSAIAHATNDYITFAEVNKGISDSVGNAVKVVPEESEAKYTNIIFTATVVDGKITTLEYSYTLDANLKIKLAIPSATGTGQAVITGKYTEIKY